MKELIEKLKEEIKNVEDEEESEIDFSPLMSKIDAVNQQIKSSEKLVVDAVNKIVIQIGRAHV